MKFNKLEIIKDEAGTKVRIDGIKWIDVTSITYKESSTGDAELKFREKYYPRLKSLIIKNN